MKNLFSDLGVTHVIALRHAKPESCEVLSVLSDESEEEVKRLAQLIKKHVTKGAGVVIVHSHEIKAFHTATVLARVIDYENTLTIGLLALGDDEYHSGQILMESLVQIVSGISSAIKAVIFVGHYEAIPGIIDAVSRSIGGCGLERFVPNFCDGCMAKIETGTMIVHLREHLEALEAGEPFVT
ncbi:MAG: hypothetical protein WCO09_03105 [bacterium]